MPLGVAVTEVGSYRERRIEVRVVIKRTLAEEVVRRVRRLQQEAVVRLPAGVRRVPAGVGTLEQRLCRLKFVAQEREVEAPQVVARRKYVDRV